MTTSRLVGAKEKIKRAKEHIRKIETLIGNFLDRCPYRVVTEDDPVSGDELYRVKILKFPPLRWSTIIGDAIQNLRVALDYLARQLVIANKGSTQGDIYFPIDREEKKLEATSMRKIQGTSGIWQADIWALRMIQKLKPYKGGNPPLSRLHALSIADKHQMILVVGSAYRGVQSSLRWSNRVGFAQEDLVSFFLQDTLLTERRFPLKNDEIIFRIPAALKRHGSFQEDTKLTFYIAFGENEAAEGESVLDTLHEFVNVVERIVDEFDRAFFSPLP